ncbi:Caspase domain-containing protein [cf. Phormidesmis sp. LEGE 11477]|uniref:Caspase domain-containing protein n=1 Tax=cf. Phormidesmis sp. LEGE 11477 TaxID=1828680 RepID=UPI001880D1E0|nr:Caspase domain-containing protein [cf. Phormidesmis sp. LEGE 11477]MBE9063485.1 Caspase domain-containing protein [cf. Phormidesmis sp. LEGE 11477]
MTSKSTLQRLVSALGLGILMTGLSSCQPIQQAMSSDVVQLAKEVLSGNAYGSRDSYTQDRYLKDIELPTETSLYFGAVAGGGAPSYNEIALEKNVLYFQRSLRELGFSVEAASLFFASGNDWEETVRYLDEDGDERFKAAEIPELDGGATIENTYSWFKAIAEAEKPCPAFFYFTGHGAYNPENEDDNALILWEEDLVSVQEFTSWLAPLPDDQPFVTMMAQCYAGAFANLIYENGDPEQPVALQTRCGFFATVASRPSVGCTPAVNEADYKDYSSSFFAGLTGRDRIGNPVSSADYNQDNQISYAEAHAFAKVDEETTDWPISTVEAWLQRQVSPSEIEQILAVPIEELSAIARPEQRYVVTELSKLVGFEPKRSYTDNDSRSGPSEPETVDEAYRMRLRMEIINIGAEERVRASQDSVQIAALDRILSCEAGSWQAL